MREENLTSGAVETLSGRPQGARKVTFIRKPGRHVVKREKLFLERGLGKFTEG